MVGTSAIRSPAARHRMTARRKADTVRTIRMGMGTGFVGLGSQRANYQSGGGEATCAALRVARPGAGIAPQAGYGHLMGGSFAR